jgi:taurine transport system substrate-binding protein
MKGDGWELMTAQEQEAIGIRVFDVIAVTNEFAVTHPDLVIKFLEVTDKAIDYLEDHPDEAKPVIAEAAGMDLKESNIVLSLFRFPRRDVQLSERWMDGGVQSFVKQVADFYVKQGRTPAALDDYGPTIDASFYEQVE